MSIEDSPAVLVTSAEKKADPVQIWEQSAAILFGRDVKMFANYL